MTSPTYNDWVAKRVRAARLAPTLIGALPHVQEILGTYHEAGIDQMIASMLAVLPLHNYAALTAAITLCLVPTDVTTQLTGCGPVDLLTLYIRG